VVIYRSRISGEFSLNLFWKSDEKARAVKVKGSPITFNVLPGSTHAPYCSLIFPLPPSLPTASPISLTLQVSLLFWVLSRDWNGIYITITIKKQTYDRFHNKRTKGGDVFTAVLTSQNAPNMYDDFFILFFILFFFFFFSFLFSFFLFSFLFSLIETMKGLLMLSTGHTTVILKIKWMGNMWSHFCWTNQAVIRWRSNSNRLPQLREKPS